MGLHEIVRDYLDKEEERIKKLISETESPIEEIFCAAVHTTDFLNELRYYLGYNEIPFMRSQVEIGPYRVDFVITTTENPMKGVREYIVECDGHEFHHATPEQVEKDNKRDRYLIKNGHVVFHVSGSEIVRDVDAVLSELMESIVGFEEAALKWQK